MWTVLGSGCVCLSRSGLASAWRCRASARRALARGVGSWTRAAVVAARWLSEGGFGFGCVGVLGCVGSGSGVIKPAGLALLTAL